jgi:hypothetical protein
MALDVEPRVEMIAHLDEVEASLLGTHGLSDDLLRPEPFREELVPDLHVIPHLDA